MHTAGFGTAVRPIESANELGRLYTAHLLLPQVKSVATFEGIDALMLAFTYLLALLAPAVTKPMGQLAAHTFRILLFATATATWAWLEGSPIWTTSLLFVCFDMLALCRAPLGVLVKCTLIWRLAHEPLTPTWMELISQLAYYIVVWCVAKYAKHWLHRCHSEQSRHSSIVQALRTHSDGL